MKFINYFLLIALFFYFYFIFSTLEDFLRHLHARCGFCLDIFGEL